MNIKVLNEIFENFLILVYNEDLEEDNSDWNEAGEDEEEDEIDSDGKFTDHNPLIVN